MEGKQVIPMKKRDFTPSAGPAGVGTGVEHGVYMTKQLTDIDPGQMVKGPDEKPQCDHSSAGSKAGKSFKWG